MKVYQCDSCELKTDEPHSVTMKEFALVCEYTEYGVFPQKAKRKVKIHLCDNCFKSLSKIAKLEKKRIGEPSKPQTNFDKITANIDTFAKFLADYVGCDICPTGEDTTTCQCSEEKPCSAILKIWLQQETPNDHNSFN